MPTGLARVVRSRQLALGSKLTTREMTTPPLDQEYRRSADQQNLSPTDYARKGDYYQSFRLPCSMSPARLCRTLQEGVSFLNARSTRLVIDKCLSINEIGFSGHHAARSIE
jgi:hypothetical protein